MVHIIWTIIYFISEVISKAVTDFFLVNFDFKNGCKNEFEDNNEKSCSRFENRVPL